MYCINQADLENISDIAPVSACKSYYMNMHLVRFGNSIICHFLWATSLIKLCKFYTSISQGHKKFLQVDWIKCIMEILWSLGKNHRKLYAHLQINWNQQECFISELFTGWLFKVKISTYKSDFILGSEISWTAAPHLNLTMHFLLPLFDRVGSCIKVSLEEWIPFLYKI